MKIEQIAFDKLKEEKETVIRKLGELEAQINKYSQRKLKMNASAQTILIQLKEYRKTGKERLESINKRLKKGF